jgi:hypothetical protein
MSTVTLDPQKMSEAASRLQHTISMLQETTMQMPAGMPMLMPPRVVGQVQAEVGQIMAHGLQDTAHDAHLMVELRVGSVRIQLADGSGGFGMGDMGLGGPGTVLYDTMKGALTADSKFLAGLGIATRMTKDVVAHDALKSAAKPLSLILSALDAAEAVGGSMTSKQPWYWQVTDALGRGAGSLAGADDAPTKGTIVLFLGATAAGIWTFNSQYIATMVTGNSAKRAELDKAAVSGKYGVVTQATHDVGDLLAASAGDAVYGGKEGDNLLKGMAHGDRGGVGKLIAGGIYANNAVSDLNPLQLGIDAARDVGSSGSSHHVADSLSHAASDGANAAKVAAGAGPNLAHLAYDNLSVLAGF